MTTDEIDTRLLNDLRGLREVADDLRLDPPPLPDVRRRAGRRHRARVGRNTAGVAALVAAGVVGVLLLPAPGAPEGGSETLERVQLAGTVMPKPRVADICTSSWADADTLPAEMLRLPDAVPAGWRATDMRGIRWDSGCPYDALNAWHVDRASSRIDQRIKVGVLPAPTEALPSAGRCRMIAKESQAGGCVTLDVGGQERPVWWWNSKLTDWGDAQVVSWVDGDYLWTLLEFGLDDAALKELLAGIQTSADGTVKGSLPAGFEAWQPPPRVESWFDFSATYGPPGPEVPHVTVRTSNSAGVGPFGDSLMKATGNSPAGQPLLVDVNGRQGLWSVDPIAHQRNLVWSAGNGVTVTLHTSEDVDLDEALEIARSVRQVPGTDPRLALLMPVCALPADKPTPAPLPVPCGMGERAP
jgi:hypothetical protein